MFFGRDRVGRGLGAARTAIHSILVVEDEPLVAFDNEHFLEQAGYAVVATVDAYDQAIAAIDAGGVDLVIADIGLHGPKTGVDVALYAHGRTVPVLFVTGACPADARHLAVGCLAKPYSQRDLLAAIGVVDAVLLGVQHGRVPAGMQLFRGDQRPNS
ncbi:response regulator [Sphingobium sp. AN641]|uniref:response regulator n=1 Tax=Sphingobium sp. AN641 TaxID=3133443 RepID=UPI0030BC94E4